MLAVALEHSRDFHAHLVLLALGENSIVGLETVRLEELLSARSADGHVEEGVAHGDEEGSGGPVLEVASSA